MSTPDVRIGTEFHAFLGHLRHAPVDEVLLHLEVGNAVAEQSADAIAFSKSTTSCPARASCCAHAIPAGPEPTTATRLPVLRSGSCGTTQPSSQPLSMMKCSIDLMPTGSLLMLSVHDASHGAGHTRPVNSGKLFVWCSVSRAVLPLLLVHEIVPVRDDVVHRASRLAERDAAVHAARALLGRGVVGKREDELAVVVDALGDGLRHLLDSLQLQEACDLAHGLRFRFLSCRGFAAARLTCISVIARRYSCGNTFTNFPRALSQSSIIASASVLPGEAQMTLDHLAHDRLVGAVEMPQPPLALRDELLLRHRLLRFGKQGLERHHRRVAALRERAVGVVDVRQAAAHAGGEVAPRRPSTTTVPPVMYSQP
jgi:hypothetical protein